MSSEVSRHDAMIEAMHRLREKHNWKEESILIESIREGAANLGYGLTYDEAWLISAYVMRDLDVNVKEDDGER